MIKDAVRRLASKAGIFVASSSRLGIDVDLDLARLSAESPIKTIFDVGANFGQTACRLASAFPQASILSFEPVPTSFSKLCQAVKHLNQVRIFNVALGEAVGTAKMQLDQDAGRNTINVRENATGTVEVKVDTVDQIAADNNVGVIDLLKIDVEGYELQVLRGASRKLNEGSVRFVYAECALAPTGGTRLTSLLDLHKMLDAAGFCFVNYYAECFSLRSGEAMGNVLFALKAKLPSTAPGSVRNIIE